MRRCAMLPILIAATLVVAQGVSRAETLENIGRGGNFNVCANPAALPYTSEEPDQPGFQIDLQRQIAQLMGWQPTVTWLYNRVAADRLGCGAFMGRMLRESGEPLVPMSGAYSVSHRPTRPYLGTGYVVVLPVGSRVQFSGLEDLAGLEGFRQGAPMGVALGAPGVERIEQAGIPTASYLYQEQIIEGVLAGDVAAGLVVRENAAWYLSRRPGSFVLFELFRVDPAFRWNLGMDLRGADPDTLAAINQIIGRFSRDGTLVRILARYGITYQPPFPEG